MHTPHPAVTDRPISGPLCTHEDVEELEDALVGEDVQHVARDGLNDRQAVDLVLDQGVDGVEEAAGGGMWLCPEAPRSPELVPTPGVGVLPDLPPGQELTYHLGRCRPVA